MTGPPLPRPIPDSNAIGKFTIGVSPIGTIRTFDPWVTVISQYANSPTLTQMILNLNDCIDQTADLDNFFDLIWNVDTAQGYGLDVWGRIVGVSRILTVSDSDFLGFASQAPTVDTWAPLGEGVFYSGTGGTDNFELTDSAFRILIFAKALSNISDGSSSAINALLRSLFPSRGNCYVTDDQDMTMTYTFEFALTPVEAAIVSSSGILPKPVGVAASVVQAI